MIGPRAIFLSSRGSRDTEEEALVILSCPRFHLFLLAVHSTLHCKSEEPAGFIKLRLRPNSITANLRRCYRIRSFFFHGHEGTRRLLAYSYQIQRHKPLVLEKLFETNRRFGRSES